MRPAGCSTTIRSGAGCVEYHVFFYLVFCFSLSFFALCRFSEQLPLPGSGKSTSFLGWSWSSLLYHRHSSGRACNRRNLASLADWQSSFAHVPFVCYPFLRRETCVKWARPCHIFVLAW